MNQEMHFYQIPINEQIREAHQQMGMPPPMPTQLEIMRPDILQQIDQETLPPIPTKLRL